jgi:hypothetical protein
MMNEINEVKSALKAILDSMLNTSQKLQEKISEVLRPIEDTEQEWSSIFTQLRAANSQLHFRPWNRYYQIELKPASQPLFLGIEDEINEDHYREISQEYVNELTEKYQTPTVHATKAAFDDVTIFFGKTASRVLTLRFFTNSEVLLKRFEFILAPPWSEPINVRDGPRQFQVPFWMGQPVHEYPPHLVIHAIRSANIGTLRILKQKLHEISATAETARLELPFSEKLQTPNPVPQTLIDFSTNIEHGVKIDGSAIGVGAKREEQKKSTF